MTTNTKSTLRLLPSAAAEERKRNREWAKETAAPERQWAKEAIAEERKRNREWAKETAAALK